MTAKEIKASLDKLFPEPKCELDYNTPFQLLVAVILSAQCTDKRVNIVTKELFKAYGTPETLAKADLSEIENLIHSCGFYHNKAVNIIEMSKTLVQKYDGRVPPSRDEMTNLPGVGRKTANVVIGEAFGGNAIPVDTHVLRVSNRLGLAHSQDPLKVELALEEQFNKKDWYKLHLQLVHFGRYLCKAQKPECWRCPFVQICHEQHKNFDKKTTKGEK